jgi:uncharacterized membrane protein
MTESAPSTAHPERSSLVRWLRRVAVVVVGVPVTLLGLVLLVAPGPGTPLLIAGLAILAIEFQWAHNQMSKLKQLARSVMKRDEDPSST